MTVSSPYAAALGRVPVREEAVAVLGSTTRYWDYGERDATTTLVLVHGFRGDHHGLEPVVAQLDGIRMISPDLPGFGASTPMTEAAHDIAGYGRWLRAFVDGLGLTGRVVLLGHSFGSIVVSGALAGADGGGGADSAAERPAGVVLVNPIGQPALEGPRGLFTRLAIFYYWLAAVLPERLGFALLRNRVIVRVMSMAMAKTKEPALRRWIHDQHDRYFSAFSDRQVVLEAFRASVSHDVSEYAGRIPERTLLVAAEKDDITPIAAEYRLQTLFPDAELVVIPDVGHLIHYETPAAAARAIQRFVAELPGERA
ncbi:Pimeloyl-ACP methyl ester carboxylesterase [Leifsonia sp. 98AMF]|uniref:alpha/beta fold hydrolase n=1 Tax=unclassified Leifsonia TaxID=2663824 RepID=UPI00087984DF|nr:MULTISPECIES: alpha/beta hydrolase [unclassified Leifsonia]SDH37046.1 Pimeloyl-ACP methyl ester carboxylesterase [Leifsonia sp. 197AMF]SDI98784.1 Pimeloyl-ACP methyl ester carboxylesterase [Leifsonia sp. 466MF]SDJ75949.1 Pimeloyl-ACP methyl ester carboxylesterase [Leifsonia sp. 157MF]SDO02057.1 Pimeloyl-ACP methyl ester carboxylesterase [Leifsonia sp. 509MF]SEN01801.1 Pimeloyl-ACP methyl ester carboxylesterase [Leifsonia sp. 467MF]